MRSALLLGFIAALGFALGKAEPASASNIEVSPVNVNLARAGASALLTVTNQGTQSINYSLAVYAWRQDEAGTIELSKTSDIIFFPAMLTLNPGDNRNVRIGTQLQPGDVEQTFRILFDELPSPQTAQAHRLEVHVLTRISVPIFLAPISPHVEADVTGLVLHKGALEFHVTNLGNVHVVPRVTVAARNAAGGSVYSFGPQGIWYILAGGARNVKIPLSATGCAQVRSLAISVEMDSLVVKRELATPSGACAS